MENKKGYYYAIGDIHGYLELLKKSIDKIKLENMPNKLIFLGDYIDGGPNSCEVLYYIKNLFEKYNNQVIALRGNHEEMFLEWLLKPDEYINYFIEDNLNTLGTFLEKTEKEEILQHKNITKISKMTAEIIKNKHKELILWLNKLPYYFETENQIFVHAGINEEDEDLWKLGTSKEEFTNKFPPSTGHFKKDIIAGHVGLTTFRGRTKIKDIFYDGKSHYYIDGIDGKDNEKTMPILCYDKKMKKYYVL